MTVVDLPELPAIGKPTKPMLIGGAVLAALLGVWWWRSRSASSSATDATANIDPLTGLPYSAEANAGATGGNAGGGLTGGSTPIDESATGVNDIPSWTADVIDKLGGTYEPGAIYAALGSYLASEPITADQAVIVRSAWTASGKPPGGPASYTLTTSSSTPGGGGSGGGTKAPPAAPRVTALTKSSVSLAVTPYPGATSYEWAVNGADHAHTTSPSYVYDARPDTAYNFSVRVLAGGHDTPQSGSVAVTTPKG